MNASATGISLIVTLIEGEVLVQPFASVTRTLHPPDRYGVDPLLIIVESFVVLNPGKSKVLVLDPNGPIHSYCEPIALVDNTKSSPSQIDANVFIVGTSAAGNIEFTSTL